MADRKKVVVQFLYLILIPVTAASQQRKRLMM